MKCPSSRASASRNSFSTSSSVMPAAIGLAATAFNTSAEALERVETAAYKPPDSGGPCRVLQSPTQVTGVRMKLIAWAIPLAAPGLTRAAPQPTQEAAPRAAQPIKEVAGPAAATAPSERAQGQSLDAANAP